MLPYVVGIALFVAAGLVVGAAGALLIERLFGAR
jgi:hypothetical protein